ncbi:virulence-associated E family protein [Hyphomicrobium facile]|uniref:Virulence-associated protein E n=1 Tax=Hyphomicrobium facile TaxID=51670 RepID=A0A1I7NE32_9HYPH|nr:virulence-associated E family protein [Hyphomicrobium facile]SFV32935.1 Virulence-associated protein E [Hyphomicrobium facile]
MILNTPAFEEETACEGSIDTESFREKVETIVATLLVPDGNGGFNFSTPFTELSRKGLPLKTIQNTREGLMLFRIAIAYNSFANIYELRGVAGHSELTDASLRAIWSAFEQARYQVSQAVLIQHLFVIAEELAYNPLHELFNRLEVAWDGQPRLATFLSDYARVEQNEFTSFVGKSAMIAAVRRVRFPGTPYKYVPVLEGGQDARKSSFLRALAFDKYFDDNLEIGASSKEVIELMGGILIAEFGEMAQKKRSEIEKIKSFVSRAIDRARRAYDRTVSTVPRQFVCWGTTNDHKYLSDPTGSVRFWPLKCAADAENPIDVDGLKDVLLQLWGEAAAMETKARKENDLTVIYPTADILALARAQQDERFTGGEIYERLLENLDPVQIRALMARFSRSGVFIPFKQVCAAACLPGDAELNSAISSAIKQAMTKLGFIPANRRVAGKMTRGYMFGELPTGDLSDDWLLLMANSNEICLKTQLLEGKKVGEARADVTYREV